MTALRRRGLLLAGVAGPALGALSAAAQEAWPSRPIRVVVPFAPGGIVDVLARLLSDRMGRGLGQPLVVETPTVAEAGMPGFEAGGWYGLLVPAEVVSRLHAEAVAALQEPEMAKRIAEMGSPDVAGSPEAFRALIAAETERWRKVLAGGGASAQRD